MTSRSDLATEWSDEHMKRLQASSARRRQVAREVFDATPEHGKQLEYEAETEKLRMFIQKQREVGLV
jgi:hypothetical protein